MATTNTTTTNTNETNSELSQSQKIIDQVRKQKTLINFY